jgi:hypothetical protein
LFVVTWERRRSLGEEEEPGSGGGAWEGRRSLGEEEEPGRGGGVMYIAHAAGSLILSSPPLPILQVPVVQPIRPPD